MIRPLTIIFLIVAATFTACENNDTQKTPEEIGKPAAKQGGEPKEAAQAPTGSKSTAETPEVAVARLQPTQGHDVHGTVRFTRKSEGAEIVADLQGLSPGKHGFHIHEKGDCSAPDAGSAGGIYNPFGNPHGAPDNPPAQRQVGDLGNIEAGQGEGTARYKRLDHLLQLDGPQSIIGKSVVVTSGADDLSSQPAGNSGSPVACGVIEKEK